MRQRRWFDQIYSRINRRLPQLKTFLLALLVFFLPTNLFIKFFENSSYVNGLQIDYLLVKFYLSDILILLLLSTQLFNFVKNKKKLFWSKKNLLNLGLITIFFIRQILTHKPLAAVYYLVKLGEMCWLFNFLKQNLILFKNKLIKQSFLATIFFQSSLALYQFLNQKPLYGFCFLGETQLNNFYGIAKANFAGSEKILPYATTAHPNILAGVIVIYTLIYLHLYKNQLWLKSILLSLTGLIIYLTQSWSAGLLLLMGLLIIITKNKFLWLKNLKRQKLLWLSIISATLLATLSINQLAVINSQELSLTRRAALQKAAWAMFKYHPFLGVGLNNFTANLNNYTQGHLLDTFVQPVHHLPLLVLAENGLLGLSLLSALFKLNRPRNLNHKKLIKISLIFLPLILLDHYLLTNQVGLLLAVLSLNLF